VPSAVAQVGDVAVGICTAHTTPIPFVAPIVTGSPIVTTQAGGVATVGSIAVASCGHAFVVVTGSATVTAVGLGVARTGDLVVGTGSGVIVSGAPNITST